MENIEIQEKIRKVNKKLKLNIIIFLIQIVLVVGIWFEMTRDTGSCSGMDPIEIQAHNLQFLSYSGKQKGAQVSALVNVIKSNNRQYQDRMIQITFSPAAATAKVDEGSVATFDSSTTTDSNTYDTITPLSTTTYYVTFGYGDNQCIAGVDIHVYSDVDLNSGK